MAKHPVSDERATRRSLLKQAKAQEYFASPLRCKECNMPVLEDDPECWNCTSKQAVPIVPVKTSKGDIVYPIQNEKE